MTRDKVRDVFIRRGFNLREVKSPDYTVVEHKGETVGCIYDEEVYIARNYPSLNPGQSQAYADTPKTTISFISAMGKLLEDAIDFLFDSPRRIDRDTRKKMVADIRTYFNQCKINAAIAKIPGPDALAPVNPSAGTYEGRGSYEELTFPTPPSIERLME